MVGRVVGVQDRKRAWGRPEFENTQIQQEVEVNSETEEGGPENGGVGFQRFRQIGGGEGERHPRLYVAGNDPKREEGKTPTELKKRTTGPDKGKKRKTQYHLKGLRSGGRRSIGKRSTQRRRGGTPKKNPGAMGARKALHVRMGCLGRGKYVEP